MFGYSVTDDSPKSGESGSVSDEGVSRWDSYVFATCECLQL